MHGFEIHWKSWWKNMKFNSGLFARGRGGKSTFNFMQRATAWIFDIFFLSRKTINFPSVLCKRFFFFCLQPKSEINKLEDNQSAFLWGVGGSCFGCKWQKIESHWNFQSRARRWLKKDAPLPQICNHFFSFFNHHLWCYRTLATHLEFD